MGYVKEQEPINVEIKLSKTQSRCWEYLTDNETTDICFGGGVAGGKTWLGALWIISNCIQYPGTRWLIGRTVLQTLKLTTLKTTLEVFSMMKLKAGEHYNYNQQNNVITLYNGSEIILKDLDWIPSDSQYDRLGSLEITGAFLDESQQLTRVAYSVVKSRIRFKLNEYNLKPRILLTCNPGTNFLKTDFYDPWIKNTLEKGKVFVQSLITDNPHISEDYIENLKTLPPVQQKRLLQGSWTFNEDEDNVFFYDHIIASVFRNDLKPNDMKYLSCDIARLGLDKTVVCVWSGLCLIDVKVYSKMDTVQVSNEIKTLQQVHGVHPNNIIIDSDGIGAGVTDQVRAKAFMNNASPLHNENFTNLKSQSYWKLAEYMKEGKISINLLNNSVIETLTQELLSIKLKNVDKDTKVGVMSKDEQKRILGRSPDYADAMMLRMYYELKPKNTGKYAISRI